MSLLWDREADFWCGQRSCKVIHTDRQVRAAEDLQGFKPVLQEAWQVSVVHPVPSSKSPGAASRTRRPGRTQPDTKSARL